MTWNYRIVALEHEEGTQYGIHEVYYDDKGVPIFYTSDPVPCVGESLSDIYKGMDHMLVALSKPVLTEKDFTGEIERLS
jgi:hypothetical protein